MTVDKITAPKEATYGNGMVFSGGGGGQNTYRERIRSQQKLLIISEQIDRVSSTAMMVNDKILVESKSPL